MKRFLSILRRQNYKIDYSHRIEEGSFGTIYLAKNNQGLILACKVIKKTEIPESLYENMLNEGRILKGIKHPNIIKLHHFEETITELYLYMDYYPHKDLYNFLNGYDHISEKVAYGLISQLIDAVEYLHGQHIIHRDIKLENILYDINMKIVLTDFGFAMIRHPNDPLLTQQLGSKLYAAPELLKGLPNTGYASDIWAVGVCLYLLVIGSYPFDNQIEIIENDPYLNGITPECQQLLQDLLNKDPDLRPSATKIKTSKWYSLYK